MSDPGHEGRAPLPGSRSACAIGAVTLRRRGAEVPRKAAAHSRRPAWSCGGACPDAAFPACYPVSERGLPPYAHCPAVWPLPAQGGIRTLSAARGFAPATAPRGLRIWLRDPGGQDMDLMPLPGAAGGLAFAARLPRRRCCRLHGPRGCGLETRAAPPPWPLGHTCGGALRGAGRSAAMPSAGEAAVWSSCPCWRGTGDCGGPSRLLAAGTARGGAGRRAAYQAAAPR